MIVIDPERLRLNDEADMRIVTLQLGGGRYPALVVDGFYRDPEHVRQVALGLDYLPPTSGRHPGYLAMLSLGMAPILEFLYRRFADFYFPTAASLLRQAHPWAFFRCEPRGSRPTRPVSQRPHIDDALLAGVVYLNLPGQCRGGTALYRHRATQVEALIPQKVVVPGGTPDELDASVVAKMKDAGAYDDFARWKQDHPGDDQGYHSYASQVLGSPGNADGFITDSTEAWEMTRLFEMRFNRLVIYPGFVLHSAYYRPEWFGDDPAGCRLTQNFFLAWPRRAGGDDA